MADIVIQPGTANTTLVISGSAGRQRAPHTSPENLPVPVMPALDYMSGAVQDTISISTRARLLSLNESGPSFQPVEANTAEKGGLERLLVRTYEEALRLASYAGGPLLQAEPGIDKVTFSSEARRLTEA